MSNENTHLQSEDKQLQENTQDQTLTKLDLELQKLVQNMQTHKHIVPNTDVEVKTISIPPVQPLTNVRLEHELKQQLKMSKKPENPIEEENVDLPNVSERIKKEEHSGMIIEGDAVYHSQESRPTLNATPITLYTSYVQFVFGKLIATNFKYMVYAMKGGILRVINKFTANRTLLKGHKKPVLDVKFMKNTEQSYLVSTSAGGSVIVWEIQEQNNVESKKAELIYQVILFIGLPQEEKEQFFKLVEWHPSKEFVIVAVKNDNEIIELNIPELKKQSKDIIVRYEEDLKGIRKIETMSDDEVTGIAFSRDGKYFAKSTKSGIITLYDSSSYKELSEFNAGEPVYGFEFCGSAIVPDMYNYIIIGGKGNANISLWKLLDDHSAKKLQTVTIKGQGELNHIELESASLFLVVASMETPSLCFLHLIKKNDEYAFDYISEFDCEQPILSFSSMTKVIDPKKKACVMGLFCVQTESMRLLHIPSENCYPKSISRQSPVPTTPVATLKPVPQTTPKVVTEEKVERKEEKVEQKEEQKKELKKPEHLKKVEEKQPTQENPVFDFQSLETSLLSKIEKLIEKNSEDQIAKLYEKLEQERKERQRLENQRFEQLIVTISQSLARDIPEDIDDCIQRSIQTQVLPKLQKAVAQVIDQQLLKPVQEQFKQTIEYNIPRIMQSLKDTIDRSVANKLRDPNTLAMSLRQPIEESFQNVLKDTVIPSFEQSCKKMFEQINYTFEQGLQESIKTPLKEYYEDLNRSIIHTIEKRLSAPEKMRARTQQEEKDPYEEISRKLRNQNYEEAFTIALSQGDLNVVTWICKQISPDELVNTRPLPLSQPVVLSLIQQLSYDLSTEVELKLNWLEKIGLILDPSHKLIAAHVSNILSQALDRLGKAYPKYSDPKNPLSFKFKLLMHVINSLLRDANKT